MNKEFNKLVNEILEFRWKYRPVYATFLGIHKHDHQLDKTDSKSGRLHLKKLKGYLKKLDRYSSDPKFHAKKVKFSKDEEMDGRKDTLAQEACSNIPGNRLVWLLYSYPA